jgi:glycosyltransferase involved in cell wall biosynthesis
VPNGIDVDSFPFVPHSRRGPAYLAFVGRAHKDKAPETAVEVAHRLGMPLRMAVKVNEPEESAYWDEFVTPAIDAAKVDVQVVMNGNRDDAAEVMAGACVTLMPIMWAEPFGLVMVESMVCGTPVVAFAEGAAQEVVRPGISGFLVEPGDIEGFCAAVLRARDVDPRACRDWVARNYSAETMVAGYIELFDRLIAARPSGHPAVAVS